MVWNSSIFWGALVEVQQFVVVVKFTSKQNNEQWTLVSVFGPCQGEARDQFVSWLYNLSIPLGKTSFSLGTLISLDQLQTEICLEVI